MLRICQKGFSLIELVVAMALISLLGLGLSTFIQNTDKELKNQTDDIQNKILNLGAEKFILSDVVNATPGFNYLNVVDDKGKWFYAYDIEKQCSVENCERVITLKLNPGSNVSPKSMYFLVLRPGSGEKSVFEIDPKNVFDDTSHNYSAINYKIAVPGMDISKASLDYSPWDKEKILLLNSNITFHDCFNGLLRPTLDCDFSCHSGATCNAPVKRKYKMIGVVSNNKRELEYVPVSGVDDLFKIKFQPCRQNKNNASGCQKTSASESPPNAHIIRIPDDKIDSAKDFYENLPYFPGYNNKTYLQPVELVKYYLEGDSKSPKLTKLIRETATFEGGRLKFKNQFTVLVGLQAIEFTRVSSASPLISFKITKVSRYNNTNSDNTQTNSGVSNE